MLLEEWALRWGVPLQALQELRGLVGIEPTEPGAGDEAVAQYHVRLAAARRGDYLWRNNVGACRDQSGRMIRYGLANDSERINRVIKSSDLIGFTRVTIAPEHVGRTVAQFTAYEIKRPGWHYAGTEREVAQLAFINLVNANGGRAKFLTGAENETA